MQEISLAEFRERARRRDARVVVYWFNGSAWHFEIVLVEGRRRRRLTSFRGTPRRFREPATVLRLLQECRVREVVFRTRPGSA